jgi:exodeoxyribonuclease VII large subunit
VRWQNVSDANTQQRKFYSLSQVAAGVRKHLENAIDKRFWLRAEISSGRERQGAFFGELVETDDSGKQVAKMQTRIWSRELSAIRRKFQQAGLDLQLEDGTEVGIFCSLQYDARYGLFLKVHDADPAFALGALELRRREILLRLENDGLFEPNKQRTVPLLPQRIGVITSRASAAFNDFGRTFEQSRFGFTLIAADAVVQGRQAEPSVIAAIDALVRLHVELIVIIRGGGSKTDLAYLDNDAIARTIARCPIPVWTGIGHETDTSVLDFVANQQFKTPTAVAVALVDRFSTVEDFTDGATARLRSTWQLRFKSERESLARNSTGLKQGTRKMLDAVSSSLEVSKSSMTQKLTARLTSDRDYLVRAKTQLVAAPQTALRVGAQYLADAKRRCRLTDSVTSRTENRGCAAYVGDSVESVILFASLKHANLLSEKDGESCPSLRERSISRSSYCTRRNLVFK